jgi:hypothetical protein
LSFFQNKITYLACLFFVTTCGFYVTKLPLSPIYFFFLLTLFFILIVLLKSKVVFFNDLYIYVGFYWLYLIVSQFFLEGDFNTTVSVLMSSLYLVISLVIISRLTVSDIIAVSKIFVAFSILLLCFEAVYRISHPVYILPSGIDFRDYDGQFIYPYKINSFMFQDSNFVGVFIVCLFFFCMSLSKLFNINFKYQMLTLFCLSLATISRSAIITIVVFWVFFEIWFSNKVNAYVKCFIIFSFIVAFFFLLYYISSDGSFLTKFIILNLFFDFILESSLDKLLFGVGFSNTVDLFGIGAHNFMITQIVESGFIGAFVLSIIWLSLLYQSRGKVLMVILPFLLVGMSAAGHAIPFFYTMLAIVFLIHSKRSKYEC